VRGRHRGALLDRKLTAGRRRLCQLQRAPRVAAGDRHATAVARGRPTRRDAQRPSGGSRESKSSARLIEAGAHQLSGNQTRPDAGSIMSIGGQLSYLRARIHERGLASPASMPMWCGILAAAKLDWGGVRRAARKLLALILGDQARAVMARVRRPGDARTRQGHVRVTVLFGGDVFVRGRPGRLSDAERDAALGEGHAGLCCAPEG